MSISLRRWWGDSTGRTSDRCCALPVFANDPLMWRLGQSRTGRGRPIESLNGSLGVIGSIRATEGLRFSVQVSDEALRTPRVGLSAGSLCDGAYFVGHDAVIVKYERFICCMSEVRPGRR